MTAQTLAVLFSSARECQRCHATTLRQLFTRGLVNKFWGMSNRVFLLAYDICDTARLRRVGRTVKGWRACGQKSVAECWLTEAQLHNVCTALRSQIVADEDRLHIVRLDPRQAILLFGIASRPSRDAFVMT